MRGQDLNLRPSGYEPDELPGCSTPRRCREQEMPKRQALNPMKIANALSRSGGDLLSHALRRSTIGATVLNRRVRDGIGCFTRAMTTKPGKRASGRSRKIPSLAFTEPNQANRAISTGQLNALPRLHLRPIEVVICHCPHGRPCFEGGFPLRCLQRLSCPHIATLRCGWRHNRSTSGASTPVLSY